MSSRRRSTSPRAADANSGDAGQGRAVVLPSGPPQTIEAFQEAWLDYLDEDVELDARRNRSLFHRAFAHDPDVGNHMINRTEAGIENSSLEDFNIFLEIETANGGQVFTKTMSASSILGTLVIFQDEVEAIPTPPCPPLADCACNCIRYGRRNSCTCYAVYHELDDEDIEYYYEEFGTSEPILEKRSSISPAFRRWLQRTFGLEPRPGPHASDNNRFTARVFVEKEGVVTCLGRRALKAPQEAPSNDGEGLTAQMRNKVTLTADWKFPTKIATTPRRPSDGEVPFFMFQLDIDVLPLNANGNMWQVMSGKISLAYGTAHLRGAYGYWPIDNSNDSLCLLHEAIAASHRGESDYINTAASASRRRRPQQIQTSWRA